jgi:hypothetical protein
VFVNRQLTCKHSKLNPEFKPINTEADATKNGYQYILTLNGGEYNGAAQSASITLECDESQNRNVSSPRVK